MPIGRPTRSAVARPRQSTPTGARPGLPADPDEDHEARRGDQQRPKAGAGRPEGGDRSRAGHQDVVGRCVKRQHGERHLQEDAGFLGGGQDRAKERDAEHRHQRDGHGAGVALPCASSSGSRPRRASQSGRVQTRGTSTAATRATAMQPLRSSRSRSSGSAGRRRRCRAARSREHAGAEVEEDRVEVAADGDGGQRLGAERADTITCR